MHCSAGRFHGWTWFHYSWTRWFHGWAWFNNVWWLCCRHFSLLRLENSFFSLSLIILEIDKNAINNNIIDNNNINTTTVQRTTTTCACLSWKLTFSSLVMTCPTILPRSSSRGRIWLCPSWPGLCLHLCRLQYY